MALQYDQQGNVIGNYDAGPSNTPTKGAAPQQKPKAEPSKADNSAKISKSRGVDQYAYTSLSYPSDIMSKEYGSNYVMFYINVNIDSKLAKDNKDNKNFFVEDVPERRRGPLLAKDRTKTGMVASQSVGAGTVAGIVSKVGGSSNEGALGDAGKAAGGMAILTGSVASQAASATRAQKRLKSAIALHIPNQLSTRYSASWDAEETLGFQAAEDIVKAVGSAGSKSMSPGGGPVAAGKELASGPAATVTANVAMSKVPGGNAVSAVTGLAPNPKKEQVFKNVDFRTFQFEYQFFPRNETEAQNVMNIIYEFKYHMHPEYKDATGYLFIYPSEFDITYFTGDSENKYINRHTSCVLTEMNVNYTPNGNFNTFANGMPTQINITLSFKELGIITKELIAEGL